MNYPPPLSARRWVFRDSRRRSHSQALATTGTLGSLLHVEVSHMLSTCARAISCTQPAVNSVELERATVVWLEITRKSSVGRPECGGLELQCCQVAHESVIYRLHKGSTGSGTGSSPAFSEDPKRDSNWLYFCLPLLRLCEGTSVDRTTREMVANLVPVRNSIPFARCPPLTLFFVRASCQDTA